MKPGMRGKPKLGKWDYDGEFTPDNAHKPFHRCNTFSVGIFQWIQASSRCIVLDACIEIPLKRGPVVCRVRGLCSNPQAVYDKAEGLCLALDDGPMKLQKTYIARRAK